MTKIKKIYLENYCGYQKLDFDFTDENSVKNMAVFFGPNGFGKSTLLQAIQLLSNPYSNLAKQTSLAFKKFIYHPDYEPDYLGFKPSENKMRLEGIFETEGGDKRVIIEDDGVKLCELDRVLHGHAYYIDADNGNNMRKFQIDEKYVKEFLRMAKIVYGFDCEVARKVEDSLHDENGKVTEKICVYMDFIIHKKFRNLNEITKVHFKSMSDGERKIATLLSYLFCPDYIDGRDIILIDNIDQHVYFARHPAMIDKMLEYFPGKQFILTTHSGTMISHVANNYGRKYLYDLEEIKDGVVRRDEWAY